MANPFSAGGEGVAAQMAALWDALHAAGEAGATAEDLTELMRASPAWKLPKGAQGAIAKARRGVAARLPRILLRGLTRGCASRDRCARS